jgi:glycosyltransferase involved in cell wall biosynthesis
MPLLPGHAIDGSSGCQGLSRVSWQQHLGVRARSRRAGRFVPMGNSMSTTRRASAACDRPADGRLLPPARVLYAVGLDPSKKFGSLEEQLLLLAGEFRARGGLFLPLFDCTLEAGFAVPEFRAAGLPMACLDLRRFQWSTLWRLWQLIRRERIDVVHWNFFPPLCNAWLWGLTLLAPTVGHLFTDHSSRSLPIQGPSCGPVRLVKRLLLRRHRQVLCVSRFVQECLAQQRAWPNLVPCLHFINTERYRPDPAVRQQLRAQLGAGERFVVLFVGQLLKEKGVGLLLDALKQLPADVVLWVIGEGPAGEAYRAQAATLGLGEVVRFMGRLPHVQPYMQAADCPACPSEWAEAAGLVTLEAQACGLPVVASRIGGLPEYVQDQHSGLLFGPGKVTELAACLSRLHGDPPLCRALGHGRGS